MPPGVDRDMQKQRRRQIFRMILWGGGLAGVGLAALFGWLMWQVDRAQMGNAGTLSDPVEAIVVLGATVRPDGSPGPDLRSRTWWAVELYHDLVAQGESPALILTGGWPGDVGAASSVARRMAETRGVPAMRIFQAQGGQTTAEDMAAAVSVIQKAGWNQAILVSHPLHLFRSQWHFERAVAASKTEIRSVTYAAGGITYLSARQRLILDAREAAGILWASVDGWERMAGLGRVLERIVYG